MWSQHTTKWLPQSSKPPLHFQVLSACHYCTLQQIPHRIFCGKLLQGLFLFPTVLMYVYFNQRDFSQSKFHVLPTLELLVKEKSLCHVQLFVTPWTVAYQAPPSMGFFQARELEWVAISFSRASSQPKDRTRVSHIVGRHFTFWATREVIHKNFFFNFVLFLNFT